MKPIKQEVLDALEDVVMDSARELKSFFAYGGDDLKFYNRAKVAAASISGFSRIRASETNRMAIELASTRLQSGERLDVKPFITDGRD